MKTTWILVADEGIARILATSDSGAPLEQVEQITDAGAHADNADLRRDAYGRRGQAPVQGDAGHPGAHAGRTATVTASAGEDELHQEARLFSHRLAACLEEAHAKQRFDALVLIAPPRFLGLLRRAMPRAVGDRVTHEIDKDYCQLESGELQRRLASAGIVAPASEARVQTGKGPGGAVDSLPMR